jgi:hypothetical protein
MSRRLPALLGLAAAVGLAGCGASAPPKPYTAKGTIPCLKQKGFKSVATSPATVGLIAGFAANGGLRATSPSGNTVTIAFTADDASVPGTERAFRRNATGVYKQHLRDVMSAQRNAVIVWTTTPAQQEQSTLTSCLAP